MNNKQELKRLRNVVHELNRLSKILGKELSLYYSDLAFLYNHQAEIKKYFPGDLLLWQWAGIPENEEG